MRLAITDRVMLVFHGAGAEFSVFSTARAMDLLQVAFWRQVS